MILDKLSKLEYVCTGQQIKQVDTKKLRLRQCSISWQSLPKTTVRSVVPNLFRVKDLSVLVKKNARLSFLVNGNHKRTTSQFIHRTRRKAVIR